MPRTKKAARKATGKRKHDEVDAKAKNDVKAEEGEVKAESGETKHETLNKVEEDEGTPKKEEGPFFLNPSFHTRLLILHYR